MANQLEILRVENWRKMENALAVDEDKQDQVEQAYADSLLWVFISLYLLLLSFALAYYIGSKLEELHLIELGVEHSEEQSSWTLSGISSAISSWSVV